MKTNLTISILFVTLIAISMNIDSVYNKALSSVRGNGNENKNETIKVKFKNNFFYIIFRWKIKIKVWENT